MSNLRLRWNRFTHVEITFRGTWGGGQGLILNLRIKMVRGCAVHVEMNGQVWTGGPPAGRIAQAGKIGYKILHEPNYRILSRHEGVWGQQRAQEPVSRGKHRACRDSPESDPVHRTP